jgi:hypothetical protein
MSIASSLIQTVETGIAEAKTVTATVTAVKGAIPELLARGADVSARVSATIAAPATIIANGPAILEDLKSILADLEALHLKL